MAYKLNKDDFENKLNQQIKFLKSSILAFDQGEEDEAIRIATTLRILLHDTDRSKSLLNHLLLKNKINFYSAVAKYLPTNMNTYAGLCGMRIHSDYGEYYPSFVEDTSYDNKYLSFDLWWNEMIFDDKKSLFSRKDIVRNIANKEGGAHVDAKLPDNYHELTNLNSLGNLFIYQDASGNLTEVRMRNNPAYVSIRVIAQELLHSLEIARNYFLFNRRKQKALDVSSRYTGEHLYIAYYQVGQAELAEKLYLDDRITRKEKLTAYHDIMIHKRKKSKLDCITIK